MKDISIVFPHQLFKDHPALSKGRQVLLIEDELFFRQYKFHKQKLVLHRASMLFYKSELERKHFSVEYISSTENKSLKMIFQALKTKQVQTIYYVDTCDYLLERRMVRSAKVHGLKLISHSSPNFICTSEYLKNYFDQKKRYFLTEFYIEQRKRFSILIQDGQPVGGKWTFDTENRKKMPGSVKVPRLPNFNPNTFVKEAASYVNSNFSSHYGTTENFSYPVTYDDAKIGLDKFLKDRFENYGIYQDAMIEENSFLFHSLLTPALNIGLLSSTEIIDSAIEHANKNNIPINSLEGFVRQILGWREYIRALYEREGVKERTTNYWNHTRKIPKSFWNGTTGIKPVDNVIQKVLKTGYSNHIERLMVMGNFMLLCEFDPDEVYLWFMELYIDAYDWVMVPNVYGMSQFADGGLMSTKPYISGSNYILKMSNYKKGDWCEIWDALYWGFIDKHKKIFIKNPRMSMMVKQLEKMNQTRLDKLKDTREKFIRELNQGTSLKI